MTFTDIPRQINKSLERLSPDSLQLVADLLADLADKESEAATQELMEIPGCLESFN